RPDAEHARRVVLVVVLNQRHVPGAAGLGVLAGGDLAAAPRFGVDGGTGERGGFGFDAVVDGCGEQQRGQGFDPAQVGADSGDAAAAGELAVVEVPGAVAARGAVLLGAGSAAAALGVVAVWSEGVAGEVDAVHFAVDR